MGVIMSKRSIILAVLVVILFIAVLLSLFFEKQEAVDELQKYLNGEQPEPEPEQEEINESDGEQQTD